MKKLRKSGVLVFREIINFRRSKSKGDFGFRLPTTLQLNERMKHLDRYPASGARLSGRFGLSAQDKKRLVFEPS
ncbi:hypothetical protein, partial [Viridibacillus arvi]|uniref:hypothetical protein n=1 Tax=Viridibacillus arvi TaxID=263475 RepID=UPI003CFD8803